MSPPGLPGEQTLVEQNVLIGRVAGVDEPTLAASRRLLEEALALRISVLDENSKRQQLRRVSRRLAQLGGASAGAWVGAESRLEAQIDVLLSAAMGDQLEHDPRPFLARLSQPVLAIWGGLDLQVLPDLHFSAVEAALAEAELSDVELVVLPGLNHLLQPAETGLPAEYADIDLTLAPQALEKIRAWLQARAQVAITLEASG